MVASRVRRWAISATEVSGFSDEDLIGELTDAAEALREGLS